MYSTNFHATNSTVLFISKDISNLTAKSFLKNSVTSPSSNDIIRAHQPFFLSVTHYMDKINATSLKNTSVNGVSCSVSVTKLKFAVTRWLSAVLLCLFIVWCFFYPTISSDTIITLVHEFREHRQNFSILRHRGFITIYVECLHHLETGKTSELCKAELSTPGYILSQQTKCFWRKMQYKKTLNEKCINKNINRNWLREIQKRMKNIFLISKGKKHQKKPSEAWYSSNSRKSVNINIKTKTKPSIIYLSEAHVPLYLFINNCSSNSKNPSTAIFLYVFFLN